MVISAVQNFYAFLRKKCYNIFCCERMFRQKIRSGQPVFAWATTSFDGKAVMYQEVSTFG
jgi:hypothetical protein